MSGSLLADCPEFLAETARRLGESRRPQLDDLTLELLVAPEKSDWVSAKAFYPNFSLEAWKSHFEAMAAELNAPVPASLREWIEDDIRARELEVAEAVAAAERAAQAARVPSEQERLTKIVTESASLAEAIEASGLSEADFLKALAVNEIPLRVNWTSLSRSAYRDELRTKLPEQIAQERGISLAKIYSDLIALKLNALDALSSAPSDLELQALRALLSGANPNERVFDASLDPEFSRAQILENLYEHHGLDPAMLSPYLGVGAEVFDLYRRSTNLGSSRRDTTWMRSFSDRSKRLMTIEEFLRESLGLGLTDVETASRFANHGLVFSAEQIQSRWRTLGLVEVVSNVRGAQSLGVDIVDREKRQAFVSAHVIAFFKRTGRLPEVTDFVALDGTEARVGETVLDQFSVVDYEKEGRPIVPFNYNAFAAAFAVEGNSSEGFRQAWIRAKRDSVLLAGAFQIDPFQFRISDHEFRIPLNDELRRIRKEEMADRILEALIARGGEWPLMTQWYSAFGMAHQKIIASDMYAPGGAAHEHRIFDNRFDMLVEIQKANERRTSRVGEENAFSFERLRNRAIARNSEFISIFQLETLQGLLQQLVKREQLEGQSLLQQGTIDRTLFASSNFQDLDILIALEQAYQAQPEKFSFVNREAFESQLRTEINHLSQLRAQLDGYLLNPEASLREMVNTAENLAQLVEWRARLETDASLTGEVRKAILSRLDEEMKKRENLLAQDAEVSRVLESVIDTRSLAIADFKTELFPSRLEALEALRDRIKVASGFLGRARQARLSELEAVITEEIAASLRALEPAQVTIHSTPVVEAPKRHFDEFIRHAIESSSLDVDSFSAEGFETRLQALQQLRGEIEEARGFRGRSRQSRLNELDAWIADEQSFETALVDLQRRRKLPIEALPQLKDRTYRQSLDSFRRSLEADTRLSLEKRARFLSELDVHIADSEARAIDIHLVFMIQTGRVISNQEALVGYADIVPPFETLAGVFRSEREMLQKVFERYRERPTVIRSIERRRSIEEQFRRLGLE